MTTTPIPDSARLMERLHLGLAVISTLVLPNSLFFLPVMAKLMPLSGAEKVTVCLLMAGLAIGYWNVHRLPAPVYRAGFWFVSAGFHFGLALFGILLGLINLRPVISVAEVATGLALCYLLTVTVTSVALAMHEISLYREEGADRYRLEIEAELASNPMGYDR